MRLMAKAANRMRKEPVRSPLDRIDRALVAAVQQDVRRSNKELAARVGLSPSACLERMRRLRARGVIRGAWAEVDPRALGIASLVQSDRVVNVARELPIPRLLALQERALGMISVDTGPAHSAAALDCPLVVLFGQVNVDRWAPRSPRGAVQTVTGGSGTNDGILGIAVQDVEEAWDRLQESIARLA